MELLILSLITLSNGDVSRAFDLFGKKKCSDMANIRFHCFDRIHCLDSYSDISICRPFFTPRCPDASDQNTNLCSREEHMGSSFSCCEKIISMSLVCNRECDCENCDDENVCMYAEGIGDCPIHIGAGAIAGMVIGIIVGVVLIVAAVVAVVYCVKRGGVCRNQQNVSSAASAPPKVTWSTTASQPAPATAPATVPPPGPAPVSAPTTSWNQPVWSTPQNPTAPNPPPYQYSNQYPNQGPNPTAPNPPPYQYPSQGPDPYPNQNPAQY